MNRRATLATPATAVGTTTMTQGVLKSGAKFI